MTEPSPSSPATADVDPANLTGPGVTANPDPGAVGGVGSLAEENARLRAQLISENEKLKTALAESQASGLSAQGLSDEDVRRLEHPEEYTVSNEELHARLAEIESATTRTESASRALSQPAPRETVAVTGDHVATTSSAFDAEDVASAYASADEGYRDNGDGTWTRNADGARGRFGPDGFTPS